MTTPTPQLVVLSALCMATCTANTMQASGSAEARSSPLLLALFGISLLAGGVGAAATPISRRELEDALTPFRELERKHDAGDFGGAEEEFDGALDETWAEAAPGDWRLREARSDGSLTSHYADEALDSELEADNAPRRQPRHEPHRGEELELARAAVRDGDSDGDGALDEREFWQEVGQSPRFKHAVFASLVDRDGDGLADEEPWLGLEERPLAADFETKVKAWMRQFKTVGGLGSEALRQHQAAAAGIREAAKADVKAAVDVINAVAKTEDVKQVTEGDDNPRQALLSSLLVGVDAFGGLLDKTGETRIKAGVNLYPAKVTCREDTPLGVSADVKKPPETDNGNLVRAVYSTLGADAKCSHSSVIIETAQGERDSAWYFADLIAAVNEEHKDDWYCRMHAAGIEFDFTDIGYSVFRFRRKTLAEITGVINGPKLKFCVAPEDQWKNLGDKQKLAPNRFEVTNGMTLGQAYAEFLGMVDILWYTDIMDVRCRHFARDFYEKLRAKAGGVGTQHTPV